MKLFGVYFGDVIFKCLIYIFGYLGKYIFIYCSYCVLLVCCYWFNFIMVFMVIFFYVDIYFFLMFSFWCLFMVFNGIICLVVLFLIGRKIRFEKFFDCVFVFVRNVNLEKVK